jgi:hypothetical protein
LVGALAMARFKTVLGIESLRHYVKALRAVRAVVVDEFSLARALSGFKPRHWKVGISVPLRGDYLITTSQGLFRIHDNVVSMLSRIPAFGIAVLDGKLFLSSWAQHEALILRGTTDFRSCIDEETSIQLEIIFSESIQNAAGRFHQISGFGNTLWIANTARNALTKIDSTDGKWLGNICPFTCSFGHPIDKDHNHLNAVHATPEYIMFCAFKAFKRGAFGLIGEGNIDIFTTPNMGVHDALFIDGAFAYTDTFNYWKGCGHGSLIINGASIDDPYFAKNRDGVVRGVAATGNEIVVGSSFYSDARNSRQEGIGHVLVARDGSFVDRIDLPASQIYDVIRVDGQKSDPAGSIHKYEEARCSLIRALGNPVNTVKLEDSFVGRAAKKFNESDNAYVPELFGVHRS